MWMEGQALGRGDDTGLDARGEEEVAEAEAFFSAASKVDWDAVILADVPIAGDPTAPRRFELVEGTSAKFWEVTPLESGFRVRFGKVGTAGQSQEKAFPGFEATAKAMGKLVAEKVRKGYVEVSPAPEPPVPRKVQSGSDGPPDWTTEEASAHGARRPRRRNPDRQEARLPHPRGAGRLRGSDGIQAPGQLPGVHPRLRPWHVLGSDRPDLRPGTEYREMGAKQAEFAEHAADLDFLSDRESQAEPITHMIVFAEDICPQLLRVGRPGGPGPGDRRVRHPRVRSRLFHLPHRGGFVPRVHQRVRPGQAGGRVGEDEEARRYFREDGKQAARPPARPRRSRPPRSRRPRRPGGRRSRSVR